MKLENTDNFGDMFIEWKCLMSDIRWDVLVQSMIQAEIEYLEFIYSLRNGPIIFKCWWDEK